MSPEQEFCDAYLDAALWSSADAAERPLDEYCDWRDADPATVQAMAADCVAFITENVGQFVLIEALGGPAQHGHDFWLTRNRHGAGFWDRGYGVTGEILSERCVEYGEVYLDAGDFDRTPVVCVAQPTWAGA